MRWCLNLILVAIVLQGCTGLASSKPASGGSTDGTKQNTQSTPSKPKDVPLSWEQLIEELIKANRSPKDSDLCGSMGEGESSTYKGLCTRCFVELYPSPPSLYSTSACAGCLLAPREAVEWRLKDRLADRIAKAMLQDHLGDWPEPTGKQGLPCVGCFLLFLEHHSFWPWVNLKQRELSLCGMCKEDAAVDEDVHIFVDYRLTSYYLDRRIYSGLPYKGDNSNIARLFSMLALHNHNPEEKFYVTFLEGMKLVDVGATQRVGKDGRHVALTLYRQQTAAVIQVLLYGTSTKATPPPVKTEPKSCKHPPTLDSKGGSIKQSIQRSMHYVGDSDTDDAFVDTCTDDIIYGACVFVLAFASWLYLMRAFYNRYMKPPHKEGRQGRRRPRRLGDVLSRMLDDIVTLLRYVVKAAYAVVTAIFSRRTWKFIVFLFLLQEFLFLCYFIFVYYQDGVWMQWQWSTFWVLAGPEVCFSSRTRLRAAVCTLLSWWLGLVNALRRWLKGISMRTTYGGHGHREPVKGVSEVAVAQNSQPAAVKQQQRQEQRTSKRNKGRSRSTSNSNSRKAASDVSSDARVSIRRTTGSVSSSDSTTLDEADANSAQAATPTAPDLNSSSSSHCMEATVTASPVVAAAAATAADSQVAWATTAGDATTAGGSVCCRSGLDARLATADESEGSEAGAAVQESATAAAAAAAAATEVEAVMHESDTAAADALAAAAATAETVMPKYVAAQRTKPPPASTGVSSSEGTTCNSIAAVAADKAAAARETASSAATAPHPAPQSQTTAGVTSAERTSPDAASAAVPSLAATVPPTFVAAAAQHTNLSSPATSDSSHGNSSGSNGTGKSKRSARKKCQQSRSPSPLKQAVAEAALPATAAANSGEPSKDDTVPCKSPDKPGRQMLHEVQQQRQQQQQQHKAAGVPGTAAVKGPCYPAPLPFKSSSYNSSRRSTSSSMTGPRGGSLSRPSSGASPQENRHHITAAPAAAAAVAAPTGPAEATGPAVARLALSQHTAGLQHSGRSSSSSSDSSAPGRGLYATPYRPLQHVANLAAAAAAAAGNEQSAVQAELPLDLGGHAGYGVSLRPVLSPLVLQEPLVLNPIRGPPANPTPASATAETPPLAAVGLPLATPLAVGSQQLSVLGDSVLSAGGFAAAELTAGVSMPSVGGLASGYQGAVQPAAVTTAVMQDELVPEAADDDVDGEVGCVVCWEGDRTHGLLHGDLMHLCLCDDCAEKYDYAKLGCPMCRRPVEDIIRC